jgi:ATPase family AAA domain-containing protein 1
VVVIASTNRPFDLDEAVLRRLPRRIMVDLPDLNTREEILRVTMANNRISGDVNFTRIADLLEGYTGSDIKEICREAVVRIAHEKAMLLDGGKSTASSLSTGSAVDDYLQQLRPVELADFKEAIRKLKASVSEHSRELQKIEEWNDKYGEIKNDKKKRRSAVSMYI